MKSSGNINNEASQNRPELKEQINTGISEKRVWSDPKDLENEFLYEEIFPTQEERVKEWVNKQNRLMIQEGYDPERDTLMKSPPREEVVPKIQSPIEQKELSWKQRLYTLRRERGISTERETSKKIPFDTQRRPDKNIKLKTCDGRWPTQLLHKPEMGLDTNYESQNRKLT